MGTSRIYREGIQVFSCTDAVTHHRRLSPTIAVCSPSSPSVCPHHRRLSPTIAVCLFPPSLSVPLPSVPTIDVCPPPLLSGNLDRPVRSLPACFLHSTSALYDTHPLHTRITVKNYVCNHESCFSSCDITASVATKAASVSFTGISQASSTVFSSRRELSEYLWKEWTPRTAP